jgi:hypothetical protein
MLKFFKVFKNFTDWFGTLVEAVDWSDPNTRNETLQNWLDAVSNRVGVYVQGTRLEANVRQRPVSKSVVTFKNIR